MSLHKTAQPVTMSNIEEVIPALDEKHESNMIEDVKVREEEDPNSPEAILQRYPLLRDKSEHELDILNRQLRRRIDIRMLPIITICLMINYLDRSNVTNARVAGMQEDMNMTDVQWVGHLGRAWGRANFSPPESPSSTPDTC